MSKQEKSRKPLIIGIIAAVVILAVLLVLLLTQCTGGGEEATVSTPAQTIGAIGEAEPYDLYWNLDRAEYDGKSEAGLSSRQPESDGYFHIRFFKDGQILELRVADRRTVNAIDVKDLMGLEFDEDGVVINCISIDDMPVQQVGWKFYVQSTGGNLMKLNSARNFTGMELLLDILDGTGIYDMTGAEGEVGKRILPVTGDRVIAIANLAGELTHVYVYERNDFMLTFEDECIHCDKTVTWKMWNKTDKLPTATGHYQLQNDITLTVQQAIEEDGKVCLDLNGFAVDGADDRRVYTLHNAGANLALMDTSEDETGVLRGHSTASDQGGVVWVRYGAFYLYSGTLDGSDMVSKLNGTVVQVPKGCYFYMNGGTIIGGTSKYYYNEEKNAYQNGLGGTLAISGKFVMNDGVITSGKAEAIVTAWNKDGTPKTYQRGIGGNIYVAGGGEIEMNGGTIKNGIAGHSGGNIYLDGASTMVMNGGVISGGQTTGKGRNGGNVFVTTKATFTMNGGSIIYGTSRNCAGNLYINGTVNMNGGYIGGGVIRDWKTGKVSAAANTANVFQVGGRMNMYGGTIAGSYNIVDTAANDKVKATIVLGGVAKITGPADQQCDDLVLSPGGDKVTVIVNSLMDSAKIGVNASTGIFTTATKEANLDNFYSNIDGAEVCYVDSCLALGRWGCVCGSDKHFGRCDGTLLFWAPITSTTMPSAAGNYYLVKDLTAKAQGAVAENADLKLDLNGYTLTGPKDKRVFTTFNAGAKLTVTDSSEGKTGVMKSQGTGTTQGNVVWVRYGEFTLYGGTLDGSGYVLHTNWGAGKDKVYGTKDDTTDGRDGGTVSMGGSTAFTMYGGTIIGNTMEASVATKTVTEGEGDSAVTKEITRALSSPNGASLNVGSKSVFNMYGGTIRDGVTGNSGGNIYANSTAVLNLYGGTVSGGKAGPVYDTDGKTVKTKGWGGNIELAASSTLNIVGATVTGGTAGGNGGNIRLGHSNATLNMTGGTVSNGESLLDQGGNLFLSGTATLSGGQITGGTAKNGGNIGVNSSKDVTLAGVTVSGGTASGNGGNIRMSTTNTTGSLIIAEGTVITRGKAANGGSICIERNNVNKNNPIARLYITGGTVEKGTAVYGGNIYAAGSTVMEITGGRIADGMALHDKNAYGGNVYITGSQVTVSKAVISGGQAGGAELNADGTLNFGTGDSDKKGWGGNISMASGSLTIIDGAQILNGTAGRNGGSIHVSGGTLNTDNAVISGGKSVCDQGGNIWMGSKTTLNVVGGSVTDGSCNAGKNGGNIHCNANVNVTLSGVTISGGKAGDNAAKATANVNIGASDNIVLDSVNIAGYVNISSGSTIILSGKPVIRGGNPNLSLNGNDLNIENLDVGTDVNMIGITDNSAGIFTGTAQKGEESYFFSDDTSKVVGFINGKLSLEEGNLALGRYYCLCGSTAGHDDTSATNGCNGQLLFWQPWTSTTSLPTAEGNWYLTAPVRFSGYYVMQKDSTVRIDLNGYTVTDTSSRMISLGSVHTSGVTMWITDTYTGTDRQGTLKLEYTEYNGQGAIIWVSGNNKLNLVRGVLDASGVANIHGEGGAAICVQGQGEFNMYGGKIIGAKSAVVGGAVTVSAGTANIYGGEIVGGTAEKGGALYIKAGAVANISGTANISGGHATSNGGNIYVEGTLNISGGTVQNGTAARSAGNIYLSGDGSLTLSGDALVSGGTATANGGSIRAEGAGTQVTVSGNAQVLNGITGDTGGNIHSTGTLTITGGTVTGGTAKSSNTSHETADIYVVSSTAKISDCTIGYMAVINYNNSNASLTLSGNAAIGYLLLNKGTGNETNNPIAGIAIPSIDIDGEMTNTTPIVVDTWKDVDCVISGTTVADNADNFTPYSAWQSITWIHDQTDADYSKLYIGKYACLCGSTDGSHVSYTDPDGNQVGCDGTSVKWTAWTSANTLPSAAGNYYLTGPVNLTDGQGSVAADAHVALDLNGYTATSDNNEGTDDSDYRIYALNKPNGKLTITDNYVVPANNTDTTRTGGKLISGKNRSDQGCVVWARSSAADGLTEGTMGTFVLIRGELMGNNPANTGNGTVVSINSYGKFYMLGGRISNGATTASGGNVYLSSNARMYMIAGEITGGSAVNGGNVFVGTGASLTMTGGTITQGTAQTTGTATTKGGNIYTEGTVTISAGTVSDGKAGQLVDGELYYGTNSTTKKGHGANIFINSGAVTISDSTDDNTGTQILNGTAGRNGGSIYLGVGKLTVSGGTISGGETKVDRGGNIWAAGGTTLEISGGLIQNGTAKGSGGNIWCNANVTVSLTGGKITGGSASGSKSDKFANVGIDKTGTLTLGSVTIDGFIHINDGKTINISGNPQITGAATNLSIGANNLAVGTMDATARVGITASGAPRVISTGAVDYICKDVFTSDSADYQVAVTANGLELLAADVHAHCVCGGSETDGAVLNNGEVHKCIDIMWTEADELSDLTVSGNYYLKNSLEAAAQTDISGVNVNVCLNGCNITVATDAATASTARAFLITGGTDITFTSCKVEEDAATVINTIARTGLVQENGAVVRVDGESSVRLYGVKLDGSALTVQSPGSGGKHGGVMYVRDGEITMYSGTIVGATVKKNGAASHGGAVALEYDKTTTSIFNLVDGTIRDGNGCEGGWAGNVYIFKGTFNMYGGTITGGKINGNANNVVANMAIRHTGVLNMTGGQIEGRINGVNKAGGQVNLSGTAKIVDSEKGFAHNNLCLSYLVITIGDLSDGAQIGFCEHSSNPTWTEKKLATLGTGFVESEDLQKCGLHVTFGGQNTYALEVRGTELWAVKTN